MLGIHFTTELHPIHTTAFEKCLGVPDELELWSLSSDNQITVELADIENGETIFLSQKIKRHHVKGD